MEVYDDEITPVCPLPYRERIGKQSVLCAVHSPVLVLSADSSRTGDAARLSARMEGSLFSRRHAGICPDALFTPVAAPFLCGSGGLCVGSLICPARDLYRADNDGHGDLHHAAASVVFLGSVPALLHAGVLLCAVLCRLCGIRASSGTISVAMVSDTWHAHAHQRYLECTFGIFVCRLLIGCQIRLVLRSNDFIQH